jgi:plastocyanin
MYTTIASHKVKIERDRDYVIANPKTLDVKKGDTLQISSADGKFRVVFVPWPFAEKEEAKGVKSKDKVMTFERIGDFTFFCYLTPPGATRELEYRKGVAGHADGGNGNVKP